MRSMNYKCTIIAMIGILLLQLSACSIGRGRSVAKCIDENHTPMEFSGIKRMCELLADDEDEQISEDVLGEK